MRRTINTQTLWIKCQSTWTLNPDQGWVFNGLRLTRSISDGCAALAGRRVQKAKWADELMCGRLWCGNEAQRRSSPPTFKCFRCDFLRSGVTKSSFLCTPNIRSLSAFFIGFLKQFPTEHVSYFLLIAFNHIKLTDLFLRIVIFSTIFVFFL